LVYRFVCEPVKFGYYVAPPPLLWSLFSTCFGRPVHLVTRFSNVPFSSYDPQLVMPPPFLFCFFGMPFSPREMRFSFRHFPNFPPPCSRCETGLFPLSMLFSLKRFPKSCDSPSTPHFPSPCFRSVQDSMWIFLSPKYPFSVRSVWPFVVPFPLISFPC